MARGGTRRGGGGVGQPRDWHGRWTTAGGGAFRPSNSRSTRVRGGTARVTKIKGRRQIKPGRVATRLATGNTIARRTGMRPGSPLAGNKNVRYISTPHLVSRAVPLRRGYVRAAARGHSYARSRSTKAPTGGYIVSYSPRG